MIDHYCLASVKQDQLDVQRFRVYKVSGLRVQVLFVSFRGKAGVVRKFSNGQKTLEHHLGGH